MGTTRKRIRIAAAAVCLCFVLTSFLAELYIHKHSRHHCVGEECTICYHIQQSRTVLSQLLSGAAHAAFYLAAIVILLFDEVIHFCYVQKNSLVKLCVRLNN